MTTQDTKETIIQDIIFILDESGSMSSMGKEPVQAVNNFILNSLEVFFYDLGVLICEGLWLRFDEYVHG